MKCEWCSDGIFSDEDLAVWPEDAPDDISISPSTDLMLYHKWCFESLIDEERQQQHMKHAPDNMEVA